MIDENNQAWEQELKDRVAAMFAKRLNPLSAELERLEQAVVGLRARANTADPVDESEATALAAHVKQLCKEVTDQAEKRYETRLSEELEKTRAEISLNVRQTLEADFERKLTQANTDAQSQMAQLQTQLAAATVAAASVAVSAPSAPTTDYITFKVAVEEIDAQRTQSETLTALIKGAAHFAPRVAFFVVKGGDAVGWKATGFQNGLNDETVRSLSVSTQTPSLLIQALTAQTTAVALHPPAAEITATLGRFADLTPRGAVAVPLVVRGKAAAVLYADSAERGDDAIQLEAIETLVHVASMGIELLPVRRNAEPLPRITAPAPVVPNVVPSGEEAVNQAPVALAPVVAPVSFDSPSMPFGTNLAFASPTTAPVTAELAPVVVAQVEETPERPKHIIEAEEPPTLPTPAMPETDVHTPPVTVEEVSPETSQIEPVAEKPEALSIFERLRLGAEEQTASPVTSPPVAPPVVPTVSAPVALPLAPVEVLPELVTPSLPPTPTNALDAPTWMRRLASPETPSLVPSLVTETPEVPPVQVAPTAPPPMQKPSLANWGAKERETDTLPTTPFKAETPSFKLPEKLPEAAVPNFNQPSEPPRYAAPSLSVNAAATETEVRAHNDARRFARLLISEIKLYNAAKVNEGRRNSDLYSRLHDEIDRSRKVYDKRVSPTVAAKFDYFYDELVQTLAEGDPSKLGESCPGPFVMTT